MLTDGNRTSFSLFQMWMQFSSNSELKVLIFNYDVYKVAHCEMLFDLIGQQ